MHVTLLSFERKRIGRKALEKIIPAHDRLRVVIKKKLPFFGRVSLWFAVCQPTGGFNSLVRLFSQQNFSQIIARGPLAGWIALRALSSSSSSLTIQARGLAAEEFRYTMQHTRVWHKRGIKSFLTYALQNLLFASYKKIEYQAYSKKSLQKFFPKTVKVLPSTIETVSPALKTYLENNFDADPSCVTVSYRDIPPQVDPKQVAAWRDSVREELGIGADRFVYCYTGSARSWQMVDEMIDFAVVTCKQDARSFFLFFSAEEDVFKKKLQDAGILPGGHECLDLIHARDRCCVKRIDPDSSYRYLSAADVGLLLREKDPVNWVSRPTKMLEYQAVGLKIMHNDTIAWLTHPGETFK